MVKRIVARRESNSDDSTIPTPTRGGGASGEGAAHTIIRGACIARAALRTWGAIGISEGLLDQNDHHGHDDEDLDPARDANQTASRGSVGFWLNSGIDVVHRGSSTAV